MAQLEAASAAEGSKERVAPPPLRPAEPGAGAESGGSGGEQVSVLPGNDSLWEQKGAQQEAVTQDEEYEEYFGGMFL